MTSKNRSMHALIKDSKHVIWKLWITSTSKLGPMTGPFVYFSRLEDILDLVFDSLLGLGNISLQALFWRDWAEPIPFQALKSKPVLGQRATNSWAYKDGLGPRLKSSWSLFRGSWDPYFQSFFFFYYRIKFYTINLRKMNYLLE